MHRSIIPAIAQGGCVAVLVGVVGEVLLVSGGVTALVGIRYCVTVLVGRAGVLLVSSDVEGVSTPVCSTVLVLLVVPDPVERVAD